LPCRIRDGASRWDSSNESVRLPSDSYIKANLSLQRSLYNPRMPSDVPKNPSITLPGTVEKIIKPVVPTMPEQAQISVEGAEHLYKEIRIENTLVDAKGRPVKLKEGAEVDVKVEAPPEATIPKQGDDSSTSAGSSHRSG
jgi:hypothetical protein